jgi:hypothetical protein
MRDVPIVSCGSIFLKSTSNVQLWKSGFQSINIFWEDARRLELPLVSDKALSQDRESWNDSRTPRLEP